MITDLPVSNQSQLDRALKICRIFNGMWPLSGAHERIDPQKSIAAIFHNWDAGCTTWDFADPFPPSSLGHPISIKSSVTVAQSIGSGIQSSDRKPQGKDGSAQAKRAV